MSDGATQEAILAASPDDIVQSSSNDNASLDTASIFPFAKLPKDIRRMIYDILPEPVFRPLFRTEEAPVVYFETLRMPRGLMQANKFFREEMIACLNSLVVNQSIVVFLYQKEQQLRDRFLFDSLVQGVMEFIHTGRLYDDRNNIRGAGISRASFDTWTLKAPLLRVKRMMALKFQNELILEILIDDAVADIFLHHTLAKFRRQPESIIDVRAMASHVTFNGGFLISEPRVATKSRYGLDLMYTMIILQESLRLKNVSYAFEPKVIEQRLPCKSERLLLDQVQHDE